MPAFFLYAKKPHPATGGGRVWFEVVPRNGKDCVQLTRLYV